MVFWKANSSGHFLCVGYLIQSLYAIQFLRVSCKNERHFRSAPWAGGHVLAVKAAPVDFLCSGRGPPPPAVSSAVHSKGAGVPGLPSVSISTDVGKWVPRKWPMKGTWREPGAGSVFSFCSNRRGWDRENAWSEDEERFLFWPKNEMRSKYISYKSVLQKIIRYPC